MKNHIILRNGTQEHYFSDSAIYSHSLKNGFFTSKKLIKKDATPNFGLFADNKENVHIISSDHKNNIAYTLIKDSEIIHYDILGGKANVTVSDFSITIQNGILNLFYTATIGNEIFLIHCVLGNNALPTVISKIADRHYFIHENRIYFSDEHSTLGYCDLSDSKPTDFVPLFKNSTSPYIYGSEQNRHMAWKCGNDIIFDGSPVISDTNARMPIIVSSESPMLMWISNGAVYYLPIESMSGSNNTPVRFISAGKPPELFSVQVCNEFRYFYGTYSDTKLNIFGTSDIFGHTATAVGKNRDMQKLKIRMDIMQQEIDEIKRQLRSIRNTDKKTIS